MNRPFESDLSVKGIGNLIKELENYKKELNKRIDKAVKRLAEEGIEIVKINVQESNAIDTGTLLESFNLKRGDLIQNGSEWIVYTDCPWAKYVEFGTGIIGKSGKQHPKGGEFGWKHDINNHGEEGWHYIKDGKLHWTKGMESRPFMYQTAMELRKRAAQVITEVFNE